MKYTAFAATMQAVWFSHDEGLSWNRLLTPTGGIYNEARCWAVATHPQRPGELLAGTDQGLYRWTQASGRFEHLPSPMDSLQILQVEQDPHDPNFIVCGTRPGEIFISADNGGSWTRSRLNAGTECWFINTSRVTSIHFDPRDRDTIWITIEIDGVFRSTDRGETWERLVEGLRDCDTHDVVFIDRDGERRLLCSTEAGVHRSEDNGRTWSHVPTPAAPWPYVRSLKKRADGEVIFASVGDKPSGETSMLLASRDDGMTWTQLPVPEPINSTIWSIATHPSDPSLIFVATIFGQIFRSQDGGDTWEKMQRELGEIRMIAWAPDANGSIQT
ncbi:MAG: hypothetical protein QNJ73_13850 [Gammaproteobacteria bacterium]|nr:hypothetical protein [Gammaproteobacteria bacterium]